MNYKAILLAAAMGAATFGVATAQTEAPAATVAPAPVAAAPVAVAPATGSVVLREGTELHIRFEDALSSATASEGDRFSISLETPITLADGTVIPAGYRGAGEVTHSEKRKMMGQAGELNVRIDYIRIGDTRIQLRGQKGGEGDSRVGTTVALTVLFGPIGLLKKGKDIEIQKGQAVTVYVDTDATVPLPLAPPPVS